MLLAFDKLLFLQSRQLAVKSVAVRPALIGVCEVAPTRMGKHVASPKQKVKEFFGLGLHVPIFEGLNGRVTPKIYAYA